MTFSSINLLLGICFKYSALILSNCKVDLLKTLQYMTLHLLLNVGKEMFKTLCFSCVDVPSPHFLCYFAFLTFDEDMKCEQLFIAAMKA